MEKRIKMTEYKDIPEHLLAGVLGADAQKWAGAFQEIVVNENKFVDESLMLGWFANAIEQAKTKQFNDMHPDM